jgi:hypothetical protein
MTNRFGLPVSYCDDYEDDYYRSKINKQHLTIYIIFSVLLFLCMTPMEWFNHRNYYTYNEQRAAHCVYGDISLVNEFREGYLQSMQGASGHFTIYLWVTSVKRSVSCVLKWNKEQVPVLNYDMNFINMTQLEATEVIGNLTLKYPPHKSFDAYYYRLDNVLTNSPLFDDLGPWHEFIFYWIMKSMVLTFAFCLVAIPWTFYLAHKHFYRQ